MAEAIISALSKAENQDMADIVVFDINESRVEHLTATYGTKTCNNITEGMGEADVTLISVKPQNVESIGNLIQIPPKGLILSIVAGCTVDKLREVFKTDNIVRSMPNTPAMVMEAMTVWIATKQTPVEQVGNIPLTISKVLSAYTSVTLPFFPFLTVEQARYLLSAIGEQIEVKDENLIDMATAVSGSGPAVCDVPNLQFHQKYIYDLL
jgi:pyrroline-5-carboxylate reductase